MGRTISSFIQSRPKQVGIKTFAMLLSQPQAKTILLCFVCHNFKRQGKGLFCRAFLAMDNALLRWC